MAEELSPAVARAARVVLALADSNVSEAYQVLDECRTDIELRQVAICAAQMAANSRGADGALDYAKRAIPAADGLGGDDL